MTRDSRSSWSQLTVRLLICAGLLGGNWPSHMPLLRAQSQPSGPESTKEQAALVDGLLELLNEPPPAAPQLKPLPSPIPASPARGTANSASPDRAAHPLQLVQQHMLTAANYLSRGTITPETTQLQSEIVTRLDELIAELEQSQADNSPSSAEQSTRQTQSAQTMEENQAANAPQSSPAQAAPAERNQGNSERQAGEAEQNPDGPGQKGKAATAVVDLADPQALQQNVWGQLPEQVRKQMQSRMVERFLPSYRQQIEAYFQALLESQANQP